MSDSETRQADTLHGCTIAMVGFGLLALVLLVMAGLSLAFPFFPSNQSTATPQQEWQRGQTDPGVQPNQAYEYRQLLAEQEERLSSYGWQDPDRTVAHVPITRAMELMIEREEKMPSTSTKDDQ